MIPESLKENNNWICWKSELRNGKHTKIPIAPWKYEEGKLRPVSATDKENLTRYRVAKGISERFGSVGVGYSFRPEDDVVGIDLDDVRDKETGEVDDWAEELIEKADSFTEISPSGTGFHIYVFGELGDAVKDDDTGLEVYDRDRFFTVTGDYYEGTPEDMKRRQGIIDELKEEYGSDTEDEPDRVDPNNVKESPFWDLLVTDIYAVSIGGNTSHPIHGSTTGANFRVTGGGETATCFRHDYGATEGCGLNAQMMLAMEATGMACDEVRSEWSTNDELVFKAWKRAVEGGYISSSPVPYRALRHIAKEFGIPMDNEEEGILGKFCWRTAHRLIRTEYDIDVEIGGESEDARERKKKKHIKWKENRKKIEDEEDQEEEDNDEEDKEEEKDTLPELKDYVRNMRTDVRTDKDEILNDLEIYDDIDELEDDLRSLGYDGKIINGDSWIIRPEVEI